MKEAAGKVSGDMLTAFCKHSTLMDELAFWRLSCLRPCGSFTIDADSFALLLLLLLLLLDKCLVGCRHARSNCGSLWLDAAGTAAALCACQHHGQCRGSRQELPTPWAMLRQQRVRRALMLGCRSPCFSRLAALTVAGRVLQLANALLDGGGASEPGIARAGAQMLAASACLGSDSWAGKVRL
eukprot:1158282-Pelagomonas_calceolata.AAC.13